MAWASGQTTGSCPRKLVLYSLANHANSTGYCRVNYETLAAETELSVSGVKKAALQLEKAGFVRRERIRKANGHLGCYEFFLTIQGPEVSPVQGPEVSRNEPVRTRPEPVPLAKPSAPRPRNHVWDALEAVTGFTPTTPNEQADFGKTVSQLRSVLPQDVTRDFAESQMRLRQRRWHERYDGATFTHRVLRDHWGELGTRSTADPARSTYGYQELPDNWEDQE